MLIRIVILCLVLVAFGCREDKPKLADPEMLAKLIKVPLEEEQALWKPGEFDPCPPRSAKGMLPRSLSKFTLRGRAPREGKKFRDDNEVIYYENEHGSRRLRLFSQHGKIYRIQSLSLVSSLTEDTPEALLRAIKLKYGTPDKEFLRELTYYDGYTVTTFKIGDVFLITDIADAELAHLPVHVYELMDQKSGSNKE